MGCPVMLWADPTPCCLAGGYYLLIPITVRLGIHP